MRPVRRYHAKITASGALYIIITIVLSVGAVNTGNNLLYLISSLLLALMLVSGLASMSNLLFLKISLVPPGEIFAGIPARFTLVVCRKKGHALFLTGSTPFGSAHLPSVKGRSTFPLWLTFKERGRAQVESLSLGSGFPLGFFRRLRQFPLDTTVLVYPRPISRALPALGGAYEGGDRAGSRRGELSDEIRELRNYRDSDPLKWVDWKATARKGQMVARDFYRLEGDRLMIDLSKTEGGLEQALSEACYMILEGEKRGLSVSLRLPDREIEADRGEQHKKILLEAISLA